MSDKEHYEIEYTLAGEHHVDVIDDLNLPIIEVVHELAVKHHVAVADDPLDSGGLHAGIPYVTGITDVSIHGIEEA
jgi:hypothetical protein